MKKLFGGGIMAIIMMLVVIPYVSAAGTWTVEDITNENTLINDGKVVASKVDEGNKTTITYDSARFVLLEKTGTGGETSSTENSTMNSGSTTQNRPEGYAWIGFKIKIANDGGSRIVKVKLPGASEPTTLEDETDTFIDYVGMNPGKLETALRNGTNVIYTYEFIDDKNETYTVEIVIKPEGIILYGVGTQMSNLSAAEVPYNGPVMKKILDDEKSSQTSSTIDEQKSTTDAKNPNTADTIIYSVIAVIISALGLTFVYKKLHN